MWGHTGGVPGFSSYSFTTADGDKQVTLSVNEGVTLAATPAAPQAINNVLVTAFYGTTTSKGLRSEVQEMPVPLRALLLLRLT